MDSFDWAVTALPDPLVSEGWGSRGEDEGVWCLCVWGGGAGVHLGLSSASVWDLSLEDSGETRQEAVLRAVTALVAVKLVSHMPSALNLILNKTAAGTDSRSETGASASVAAGSGAR